MKKIQKTNKGFTLIELLVVIAIISILSSVVFASLNAARGKAKDAAIKEEVHQLENLMELTYQDKNNYCDLQYYTDGWMKTVGECDAAFSSTGNYKTQAIAICKQMYNNAGLDLSAYGLPGYKVYSNTSVGCGLNGATAKAYSWMVGLSDGNWYCTGSSGRKGEYSDYNNQPGCWNNP